MVVKVFSGEGGEKAMWEARVWEQQRNRYINLFFSLILQYKNINKIREKNKRVFILYLVIENSISKNYIVLYGEKSNKNNEFIIVMVAP